jgi:REP element-mobilizing transposase RayT
MRYLVTFTCYGHRLHGDSDGSVDKQHRIFGTPYAPASPGRLAFVRRVMKEPVYELGPDQRRAVLKGVLEAARRRGWRIWAAHIRPTHAHVVAEGEAPPEEILRGLKAYASRWLARLPGECVRSRRWARHGSTVWLWKDRDFHDAIVYVADRQGVPMEVFVDPEW